jgi:hypothetical protein
LRIFLHLIFGQDLPAFAIASTFVETSAGQVGAAGRIIRIFFLRHFPACPAIANLDWRRREESGETQSACGGKITF